MSKKLLVAIALMLISLSACSVNLGSTDTSTEVTEENDYVSQSSIEVFNIQLAATIMPNIEYSMKEFNDTPTSLVPYVQEQKEAIKNSVAVLKGLTAPSEESQAAYVEKVNTFIKETETYLTLVDAALVKLNADDADGSKEAGNKVQEQFEKISIMATEIDTLAKEM